ncbi:MAG: glutamate ligase domain-containing protein, partial [Kiloniellales bacterium]
KDRRVITYGFSPQAEVRGLNVEHSSGRSIFEVAISDRSGTLDREVGGYSLPMLGRHNVENALAVIAVGYGMGLDDAVAKQALATFAGVKRRFTKTGEAGGIAVIDDYGHHPVEIAAVLKAARQATDGHVIAVVQPHRYTRLRDLFEGFCSCFNDADQVLVAEVYAAGEAPIEGASRDAMVEGLRARGHRHADALEGPEALAGEILKRAKPGDLVVCLGAGNITAWAHALPGELQKMLDGRRSGAASGGRR